MFLKLTVIIVAFEVEELPLRHWSIKEDSCSRANPHVLHCQVEGSDIGSIRRGGKLYQSKTHKSPAVQRHLDNYIPA